MRRAPILAGRRNGAPALFFLIMILVVASGAGSRAYAAPLDIVATFDTSITSDPNAAAIENVINSAISFYNSNITTLFADQVNITFQEMTGGLGASRTPYGQISYAAYINSLQTLASGDSTDTTALAHLPTVTGYQNFYHTSSIDVSVALLTGLGYIAAPASDGTIYLNTSITDIISPPGQYSLFAVTEHEIDEVLGLGSDVGQTNPYFIPPRPEDLYRYDQSGNRSYAPGGSTYFSLDGLTDLAQFNNQNNGADFGDWQSSPLPSGVLPQVQDAFATPGSTPSLSLNSPEVIALDVIGYNLAVAVPEPPSLLLFGAGFGALGLLGWRRNRKAQAVAA